MIIGGFLVSFATVLKEILNSNIALHLNHIYDIENATKFRKYSRTT